MTMDYSTWSEREIWLFLKAISPKLEKPLQPKLMCMHVTSISTCINFSSRFQSIKIFDDHGLYIGNLAVFVPVRVSTIHNFLGHAINHFESIKKYLKNTWYLYPLKIESVSA